jgi:hypothetical protein
MGTQALLPEDLDNLHSFLDLNLPLDPFPLKDEAVWLPQLDSLPSPNHSQEVSDHSHHSLNHSGSSHFPFDDLIFQQDAAAAFLPPASTYSESPPSASATLHNATMQARTLLLDLQALLYTQG